MGNDGARDWQILYRPGCNRRRECSGVFLPPDQPAWRAVASDGKGRFSDSGLFGVNRQKLHMSDSVAAPLWQQRGQGWPREAGAKCGGQGPLSVG